MLRQRLSPHAPCPAATRHKPGVARDALEIGPGNKHVRGHAAHYLVVDDSAAFRQLVTRCLERSPRFQVLGAVGTLALARARRGELSFGSAGVGTGTHLTGELFKSAATIDLLHVPYRGMGPAITELVGGQISMAFLGLPSGLPQMQAGKTVKEVVSEGVQEVVDQLAEFEAIGEAYGESDVTKSRAAAAQILTKFGDQLDAIYAQDDNVAVGVAQAVKEAGLTDKIIIIGNGFSKQAEEAIKAGEMYGTLVQSPSLDGGYAVETMAAILCGADVEEIRILPAPEVRADNYTEFVAEW